MRTFLLKRLKEIQLPTIRENSPGAYDYCDTPLKLQVVLFK